MQGVRVARALLARRLQLPRGCYKQCMQSNVNRSSLYAKADTAHADAGLSMGSSNVVTVRSVTTL